jgi:hypothetical protein
MEVRQLEKSSFEIAEIEIIHIEFDIETLIITVIIDGEKIDVYFDSPAGYRVLDEGDLLEYWPICSWKNGWLYEILSEGWLSQESKREGFVLSSNEKIKEYFIIGINCCVNVLSWEAPCVEESIR